MQYDFIVIIQRPIVSVFYPFNPSPYVMEFGELGFSEKHQFIYKHYNGD